MKEQQQSQSDTNVNEIDNSTYSKKKGAGILKEQSGEESIPNLEENTKEFERETIEGTPLEIIGNDQIGYWVAMGMFRLTEPQSTIEEVRKRLHDNDWELLINLMCALINAKELSDIQKAKTKQAL